MFSTVITSPNAWCIVVCVALGSFLLVRFVRFARIELSLMREKEKQSLEYEAVKRQRELDRGISMILAVHLMRASDMLRTADRLQSVLYGCTFGPLTPDDHGRVATLRSLGRAVLQEAWTVPPLDTTPSFSQFRSGFAQALQRSHDLHQEVREFAHEMGRRLRDAEHLPHPPIDVVTSFREAADRMISVANA